MNLNGWTLRPMSQTLRETYLRDGWWDDTTVGERMLEWLSANPENDFCIWSAKGVERRRFSELKAEALRCAAGLRAAGIEPGERVCVYLPNSIEAAVSLMAAAILGAVIVPIAPFYRLRELEHIVRKSAPRVLIAAETGEGSLSAIADVTGPLSTPPKLYAVAGHAPGFLPYNDLLAHGVLEDIPVVDPDAPVVIAFTSGTTATPKGVIHCHRSLIAEIRHHQDRLPWPSNGQLVGGPIAHFTGLLCGMLLPMHKGQPVHLFDGWDPGVAIAAMRSEQIGSGMGTPFFLTSIMNHPDFEPSDMKLVEAVFLGATSVPSAFADLISDMGVTCARTYGSTEQPTIFGGYPSHPRDKRHQTDGILLAGVEVRLLDEDLNEVGIGEPGEVVARGPDLCMGYIDEEMNREFFLDDGWFRTGDVAIRDADGFYAITDRIKDIIIRNGVKIGAAEVEAVLITMPEFIECAVIAAPDERTGERAHAIVRLKPGASLPSMDAVRAHLEQASLAKQKWPEAIEAIDEFPRTPAGKIKKAVLRDGLKPSQIRTPQMQAG